MSRVKLAIAAAMSAKKTWDRIPPEQRRKLVETAKTRGPVVAKKGADATRTYGPILARRLVEAIDKARKPR